MCAETEGHVAVRNAVEDHPIRLGELIAVTVARGPQHEDTLTLADLLASDDAVLGGGARQALLRRLDPEELLHGLRKQLRLLGERPPGVALLIEVEKGVADGRPGRVETA